MFSQPFEEGVAIAKAPPMPTAGVEEEEEVGLDIADALAVIGVSTTAHDCLACYNNNNNNNISKFQDQIGKVDLGVNREVRRRVVPWRLSSPSYSVSSSEFWRRRKEARQRLSDSRQLNFTLPLTAKEGILERARADFTIRSQANWSCRHYCDSSRLHLAPPSLVFARTARRIVAREEGRGGGGETVRYAHVRLEVNRKTLSIIDGDDDGGGSGVDKEVVNLSDISEVGIGAGGRCCSVVASVVEGRREKKTWTFLGFQDADHDDAVAVSDLLCAAEFAKRIREMDCFVPFVKDLDLDDSGPQYSVLREAVVEEEEEGALGVEEGGGVAGKMAAELMYLEVDDVLDAGMTEAWKHARFVLKLNVLYRYDSPERPLLPDKFWLLSPPPGPPGSVSTSVSECPGCPRPNSVGLHLLPSSPAGSRLLLSFSSSREKLVWTAALEAAARFKGCEIDDTERRRPWHLEFACLAWGDEEVISNGSKLSLFTFTVGGSPRVIQNRQVRNILDATSKNQQQEEEEGGWSASIEVTFKDGGSWQLAFRSGRDFARFRHFVDRALTRPLGAGSTL